MHFVLTKNKNHTLKYFLKDLKTLNPEHVFEVLASKKVPLEELKSLMENQEINELFLVEAKRKTFTIKWLMLIDGESIHTKLQLYFCNIKKISGKRDQNNCIRGSRPLFFFGNEFAKTNLKMNTANKLVKDFIIKMFEIQRDYKPFVDRFFVVEESKNMYHLEHYSIKWEKHEKSYNYIGPSLVFEIL